MFRARAKRFPKIENSRPRNASRIKNRADPDVEKRSGREYMIGSQRIYGGTITCNPRAKTKITSAREKAGGAGRAEIQLREQKRRSRLRFPVAWNNSVNFVALLKSGERSKFIPCEATGKFIPYTSSAARFPRVGSRVIETSFGLRRCFLSRSFPKIPHNGFPFAPRIFPF